MPAKRPAVKPQRPSGSPGIPNLGNQQRPQTRPVTRPADLPAKRPQVPTQRPQGGGDFIGMRPDKPASANRPSVASRPEGNRPNVNRPTTLPGNVGERTPNRPGNGGGPDRPGIANRPGGTDRPDVGNRPGLGDNHPNLGDNRPGDDRHPNLDNRPGKPPRPARPERPDRWQNVQNNNNNQWNKWRQDNNAHINNFRVNRTNHWNSINTRYNERGWAGRYGAPDYLRWHGDMRNFRIGRAQEIWGTRRPYWNNCFDIHWWGSCWWRPHPIVPIGVAVSPWWWWRPFAWTSAGLFFGSTIASQPIIYDPGVTVIYEDDTYYVDGQPAGSAAEARKAARELAMPEVAETPVPDPPMEGQPEEWLPVGVWALTQQEQGDATMFVQLSIDKEGLVAGAYKNIMTGDELPIIGRLDRKTQRVAWHFGEATQTVYETGLSSLQNDVASVFVHFGENQTQTWLLVRLPSPEIPPGTVKLPEIARQQRAKTRKETQEEAKLTEIHKNGQNQSLEFQNKPPRSLLTPVQFIAFSI